MGFFATFAAWLNGQLATYIGDNTARLASVLEPAIVTVATIYIMAWGYLHLMGKIDEPVITGLKRILLLALILGVGLRLWLYNTLIVDTFYNAPAQLAAAMVGSSDPVGTIDAIWNSGGTVAGNLWDQGGDFRLIIGFRFRRRSGVVPDRRSVRVCDVPVRSLEYCAGGSAGARPIVHRVAVLRCHQAILRGVDRAAGQLRVDHRAHRDGRGPIAANRQVVRRANCGARFGDTDGRRIEHAVDRRPGVSGHASGHADRGGAGRRRVTQFVRRREPQLVGHRWGPRKFGSGRGTVGGAGRRVLCAAIWRLSFQPTRGTTARDENAESEQADGRRFSLQGG